jgi:hypothetical protein
MVGKPNLSDMGDGRPDLGAARATPGLAALDREREVSMADEGGASGAVMESEDPEIVPPIFSAPAPASWRYPHPVLALAIGLAAGVVLGIWTYRRR